MEDGRSIIYRSDRNISSPRLRSEISHSLAPCKNATTLSFFGLSLSLSVVVFSHCFCVRPTARPDLDKKAFVPDFTTIRSDSSLESGDSSTLAGCLVAGAQQMSMVRSFLVAWFG